MSVLGYSLALLIGLTLGLLGGGGAILAVPVLHYVMDYSVEVVVPMSLVVVGITSGVGAVAHWRAGTLSFRTLLAFAPPAIIGTLLGAQLGLHANARLRLTVFAAVMLAAALSMYFGAAVLSGTHPAGDGRGKSVSLIILVGAAVGILTGFVGVGGGFLYVPTLVLLAGLPMKQAIGTSLALIMISCLTGVLRYQGTLDGYWGPIMLFTAIALVGVAIGSRMVRYVSQAALRRGFAAFLLVMGAFVLLRGR